MNEASETYQPATELVQKTLKEFAKVNARLEIAGLTPNPPVAAYYEHNEQIKAPSFFILNNVISASQEGLDVLALIDEAGIEHSSIKEDEKNTRLLINTNQQSFEEKFKTFIEAYEEQHVVPGLDQLLKKINHTFIEHEANPAIVVLKGDTTDISAGISLTNIDRGLFKDIKDKLESAGISTSPTTLPNSDDVGTLIDYSEPGFAEKFKTFMQSIEPMDKYVEQKCQDQKAMLERRTKIIETGRQFSAQVRQAATGDTRFALAPAPSILDRDGYSRVNIETPREQCIEITNVSSEPFLKFEDFLGRFGIERHVVEGNEHSKSIRRIIIDTTQDGFDEKWKHFCSKGKEFAAEVKRVDAERKIEETVKNLLGDPLIQENPHIAAEALLNALRILERAAASEGMLKPVAEEVKKLIEEGKKRTPLLLPKKAPTKLLLPPAGSHTERVIASQRSRGDDLPPELL